MNPDDKELKPLTPDEVEQKIDQVNAKLNINDNKTSAEDGYTVVSWLCIIASIGFTIYGVYTLYNNDYKVRVVGGDAYNFIIYATRGTAWVCVGIVSAIIGLTFAVFANTASKSK